MAARSSRDLACWSRATARAWRKHTSATSAALDVVASLPACCSSSSPWRRCTSACHERSPLFSTVARASSTRRSPSATSPALRRDLGQQRQVVGPQYSCARRLPGREAFPHLRPSPPARAGLGHGPAAQEHALRLLLGEAVLGRGRDDRLCQLARADAVTAVLRELGRPVPRVGQVQGLAKLSGERERL